VFERVEVFIKTFLPSFFLIPFIFMSHFFLRRVLCAVTVRGLSSSSFRRAIEGGFIIINWLTVWRLQFITGCCVKEVVLKEVSDSQHSKFR
jgi:hypothetical protein